ncbi:MAG TPA: hypothetical protein PLI89_11580 [Chitinophagales bacterium]|nr:hypothetical protein [Chitinophagales bacterium]
MNKVLKIFGFILLGVAFIFLMGYATMLLWNWLIPEIFSGPVITFVQALGLLLLVKLLTGFGHWGGKGHKHHSYGHGKMHWKKKWEAKMAGMNDDEKEKFKEMYYRRCGRVWDDKKEEQSSPEQAD